MEIEKVIPDWVGKALLLSYAARKFPYIREQIDQKVRAEIEQMEKLKGRGNKIEFPVEKALDLRDRIKKLESKIKDDNNGN